MPTYRDDRDALLNQVDALKQDLEGARADAAKAEQVGALEARLQQAQRDLQAMHAELERLRGRPTAKSQVPLVLGIVLGLMCVGAGAMLLLVRSPAPPPPPPVVVAVPPAPAPVPVPAPTPERPKVVADPLPPEATESRKVVWKASVQKVTGITVSGPCTITATLRGSSENLDAHDVLIECGKTVLYDSKVPLNGMSMLDSGAAERAGKYDLKFSDKGTRSGRMQTSIDTTKRAAAAWSEDVPAFRVDLSVQPDGALAKAPN